jgi:hypothetical protein
MIIFMSRNYQREGGNLQPPGHHSPRPPPLRRPGQLTCTPGETHTLKRVQNSQVKKNGIENFTAWFGRLFTKLYRTNARKQRLHRDGQANIVFQLTFFTLSCSLKGLCHEIGTFNNRISTFCIYADCLKICCCLAMENIKDKVLACVIEHTY